MNRLHQVTLIPILFSLVKENEGSFRSGMRKLNEGIFNYINIFNYKSTLFRFSFVGKICRSYLY